MIVPLVEAMIDLGVPVIGIDLGEYSIYARKGKYHVSREVRIDDPYESDYHENIGSCDTSIEAYDLIRKDKESR